MREKTFQDSAVPVNATDAEILDWYLHRMRCVPHNQQQSHPVIQSSSWGGAPDIRGLSLSSDMVEFLSKYASLAPSADEVKNPFEYWAFVEPIFFPGLRSSLIPENGLFSPPFVVEQARSEVVVVATTKMIPMYQWTWAFEDCIERSALSAEEIDEIQSQLGFFSQEKNFAFNQVHSDLVASIQAVDESTKIVSESLLKLRKWIKQIEKSDFTKLRNSSLTNLLANAESTLKQLQRHQLLDSIEELHHTKNVDEIAMVVDEIEKIKCFILSPSEAAALLIERDAALESPQTESVHFAYPFTARGESIPRLPQLGPFCHICRQIKSNLVRCNQKIPNFFNSTDSKDVKYCCPRRFCQDCLIAYNWPRPGDTKPEYKCPICSKLCTCDRCVRNVFIRVIKSFVTGLGGVLPSASSDAPPRPVESVYEFLTLIGEFSAFTLGGGGTSNIESPNAAVAESILLGPPSTGRSRRLSASKRSEEQQPVPKRARNAIKSEDTSVEQELDNSLSSQANDETPESVRRKRRAAANIDSFYKQ